MTFSDPKVAEFVNQNFVSAWHNRAPGFRNDDPQAEKDIFAHATEAYTTRNICTFFMTPGGKVFSYFAGYLSPDLFLKQGALALEIRRLAFDDAMNLKSDGMEKVQALHKAALAAVGKLQAPASGSLDYRGATHRHGKSCRLSEYLEYAGELHGYWSAVAELPSLESVRYDYRYGNSFTEESEGATPIRGQYVGRIG